MKKIIIAFTLSVALLLTSCLAIVQDQTSESSVSESFDITDAEISQSDESLNESADSGTTETSDFSEESEETSKENATEESDTAESDTSANDSSENMEEVSDTDVSDDPEYEGLDYSSIPPYEDMPFISINDNLPVFSAEELEVDPFEKYSSLDLLGRCGVAIACCGTELMPTEERGSISSVTPSGWIQKKYSFINGQYLYNRCHLIGWQLTGENANNKNLITGTRYLNSESMLPFENMIADYIKETNNHVIYRVTPIFIEDELVCRGVQLEAYSIEDDGEGICFNVYCYNVQPGVVIDYATGESYAAEYEESDEVSENEELEGTYILNISSKKIHLPDCSSVSKMSETNKKEYTGYLSDLIEEGYSLCGNCLDK